MGVGPAREEEERGGRKEAEEKKRRLSTLSVLSASLLVSRLYRRWFRLVFSFEFLLQCFAWSRWLLGPSLSFLFVL